MTGTEYVKAALRTESEPDMKMAERFMCDTITGDQDCDFVPMRIIHGVFGVQTELGEYVDAWKRQIFYKKERDRTNIKEELGDIFWYLAILCDAEGVTFEECMEANIAKLKKRYPDKFDSHKAVNRDLAAERGALGAKTTSEYIAPEASEEDHFEAEGDNKYRGGHPSTKGRSCERCNSTNVRASTMSPSKITCQDCGEVS